MLQPVFQQIVGGMLQHLLGHRVDLRLFVLLA
jgi:hypothetical protein